MVTITIKNSKETIILGTNGEEAIIKGLKHLLRRGSEDDANEAAGLLMYLEVIPDPQ